MRDTSEDLLRAVARVIATEVLPGLEPSGWPASRLRSALMLLRYAEERVVGEQAMLCATTGRIQLFLAQLADGTVPLPPDWAVPATPSDLPRIAPGAELAAMLAANEQAKEMLGRVIRAAGAARARIGGDDAVFRARLHALLAEIAAAEWALAAPALALSPI